MQIIDKPKQFKLPYKLHQRIITSQTETKIPELSSQSKELKKIQTQKKQKKDNNISIIMGNDFEIHRSVIKDTLSKNMSYEINKDYRSKFLPEQLIHKLKEPIKALLYNTDKFKLIFRIVTYIFGNSFKISPKDVLAAQGTFSYYLYLFFTSTFYQPYSICCKSLIYLKIRNSTLKLLNLYHKFETEQEFDDDKFKATNYFICSKCQQIVLTIHLKTQGLEEKIISTGKQKPQRREERHKISMSIMVASGKFKRMRIDSNPTKNNQINATINNQQERELRKKSKTFQLSALIPIKKNSLHK